MTSARTSGPSRAITSLVDSVSPVMPSRVPVVSLTAPPVLTAPRVLHVPDGSTTTKGITPPPTTTAAAPCHAARARHVGADEDGDERQEGELLAQKGDAEQHAGRRPIVGADAAPAPRALSPTHTRSWGWNVSTTPSLAAGKAASTITRSTSATPPPAPAGPQQRRSPQATGRPTPGWPSTAWDRYHRMRGQLRGRAPRPENWCSGAGTRASHHVTLPHRAVEGERRRVR